MNPSSVGGAVEPTRAKQPGSSPGSLCEADRLALLTGRESQVLDLLMSGGSAAQIAEHLCLSLSTVRTHIHSIMIKLGVSSQLAAVAVACRARCATSGPRCRFINFEDE